MSTTVSEPRKAFFSLDFLWLLITLAVCCLMSLRPQSVVDPDIWSHLRIGAWISDHHQVPWREMFSQPAFGRTWLDYVWLFDWIVNGLYRIAGLSGILALTGVIMLACITSALLLVTRYIPLKFALIPIVLYRIALIPVTTPRPWLFSILLVTIELTILLKACEEDRPALLLWLFPVLCLWVNIHIQFVFGLGLIFIFALASSVPHSWRLHDRTPLKASWLWGSLLFGILATLVNPYGWRVYNVVAELASSARSGLFAISEMQPFAVEGTVDWIVILFLCAAVWAIALNARRSALAWLMLLSGCWFGFHKQRDVWFFLILLVTVIARSLGQTYRPNPLRWRAILAASLIAGSLYLLQVRSGELNSAALSKETDRTYPAAASDFIESNHLPGPLYNSFPWGGYLMWKLPTRLVSIDGRSNLYGDEGMARFMDTQNGAPAWKENPVFQSANTILIEPWVALASILRLDPDYRLVYEDNVAVVFVRHGKR